MRSSRWTSLAFGLLLVTAAGCGSKDSPAAAPPTAPPSTASTLPPTTVAPKPVVTLDFAGAQPRQPLTLRLAAGSTTKIAMVNKLGLKITVDGKAAPTGVVPGTRTVMEQRVDKVDPDGTGHFSVTFLEASVVPTPGADPAVIDATQAGIDALKGFRGSGVIDVHGNVSGVAFDTSSVSDPALKSILDSMKSQIGNLSAPFPQEPVGAGARWSVKGAATITGLRMETTTRFTLKSRTGDRYELDQAQDAMAVPGPAPFPNLPAGATASVTSFTLTNTGQVSGDVTRNLPTMSSIKGTGDGNFEMTVGTQKLALLEHLTIEITTAPA